MAGLVRAGASLKMLALGLSFVILLPGCHKKDSASGDPNGAGSAQPLPPPPMSVAANADNHVRENVSGEVDAFLTSQLKTFVSSKGRLPASFAEFAKSSLDSIPRPPEGKKWVIDAANVEVKAASIK